MENSIHLPSEKKFMVSFDLCLCKCVCIFCAIHFHRQCRVVKNGFYFYYSSNVRSR